MQNPIDDCDFGNNRKVTSDSVTISQPHIKSTHPYIFKSKHTIYLQYRISAFILSLLVNNRHAYNTKHRDAQMIVLIPFQLCLYTYITSFISTASLIFTTLTTAVPILLHIILRIATNKKVKNSKHSRPRKKTRSDNNCKLHA